MSPEPDCARIDAELARVRGHFIGTLENRILDLDALVTHCRAAEDPYLGFEAIARQAHKIAGLAPTLGLQDLGRDAREVELAAGRITPAGPAHGRAAVLAQVEKLLDRMEEVLKTSWH